MVRFEELQQIWQAQPQSAAANVDVRGTVDAFRRFGRRQNIINTLKTVLVCWQTWICFSKLGFNVMTVVGQSLFLAGLLNILWRDWQSQLGISRMTFAEPSVEFVDQALENLRTADAHLRAQFWISVLLIDAGVNLQFGGRWSALPGAERLLSHLGATLLPIAGFWLGLKVRAKRYELEFRPLRARLMEMKHALEERVQ